MNMKHEHAESEQHKKNHKGSAELVKSAIIYIALAVVAWLGTTIITPQAGVHVAGIVYKTFAGVLAIIAAVFVLIGLIQVWLTPEQVSKVLGKEAGWKGLLLSATLPMILGGSLFVIFPLLKTLREKGARTSSVVAFLFAWSAKAPLLPLEIKFLGLPFAALRLASIPILAILGGLLAEWIIDKPLRDAGLEIPMR
jgi:uncharacterized membrane protein YraQ (UPF0718 family)